MFRARLARVYWLSPPVRASRRRTSGYGPEAYLVFYEPMPRAAMLGDESAATPACNPNGWCSTCANPARKPNGMSSTSANPAHSPNGMSHSRKRVRQGGFQSGRYLLHFRESRWHMRRVYVGLTPGENYLAREWGKVVFNPDAICYTSVSQGGKCDVFMWVWHEKRPFGCRHLVKHHRPPRF